MQDATLPAPCAPARVLAANHFLKALTMSTAVLCLASNQPAADKIVSSLKASGFTANDISVHCNDKSGQGHAAKDHGSKPAEGATPCATGSGIAGTLVGLGIPEVDAKRYEGKVKDGSTLISVSTTNPEGITRARRVFEESHAHDIASGSESKDSHNKAAPMNSAEPASKPAAAPPVASGANRDVR
jgi:hypothetical protein